MLEKWRDDYNYRRPHSWLADPISAPAHAAPLTAANSNFPSLL
jgi:hypothetical protein